MPDEAPVMTATRPVSVSVLMRSTIARDASGWEALSQGFRQGPPNRHANGLPSCSSDPRQRHRRVPRQPTREDHARAGRHSQLRHAAGARPAPGGGRIAGRRQRRLLPAPGARPGQRRLGARARSAGGALQLDDAERTHLFDLARAANPGAPRRSRAPKPRVRPVVRRLLDQIEAPAIVSSVQGDYLAANALGRALYAPVFDSPEQPANSARFTFLDPAARDFYPDWERLASQLVASLCSPAGANPYDRNLQDLIGELSTRSDEFRVRWAAHNVRFHQTGSKRLHHPIVGELELSYETLTLDADHGLRLALYTAEAGSASQQALDLLASWTATPEATESRRH